MLIDLRAGVRDDTIGVLFNLGRLRVSLGHARIAGCITTISCSKLVPLPGSCRRRELISGSYIIGTTSSRAWESRLGRLAPRRLARTPDCTQSGYEGLLNGKIGGGWDNGAQRASQRV